MFNKQQNIFVFPNFIDTGEEAGKAIESCILKKQELQETVRIIFASAPSQNSMLNRLTASTEIQWDRIVAFHMDEYLGLRKNAPQLFSNYLQDHLFSRVRLKEAHIINPYGNPESEIQRYSKLIDESPIDIVCLGIGENGHIAFNDPPVADFKDHKTMKIVTLDKKCKAQQVHDGAFKNVGQVPKQAFSLTIPTLMRGENLFCVVTGPNKKEAVKKTLKGPISTACPASILRTHPSCQFYFDEKAYSEVKENTQL